MNEQGTEGHSCPLVFKRYLPPPLPGHNLSSQLALCIIPRSCPGDCKPWVKYLYQTPPGSSPRGFRALQSPTGVHLPNLISGYRILPGDSRLWISTTFLVIILIASYLLVVVYLDPFPHPSLSSRGFSSAFPACRILVKHDLLGRSHVLCSQSTARPSSFRSWPFQANCGVEPFESVTHWVSSSRVAEGN